MTNKTGPDLVAEARARITEIAPAEALAALAAREESGSKVVFLDVREPNEWNLGHVPGALHIPRGQLENKVEQMLDRDAHVVVYCAGGSRSALATDTLRQMGYDHASSMKAGFRGWVEAGGEIED
ncbi:MAG TPA: rhodanese-like domain-containing protein [Candidatus Elarobacter sp.]|nr:rhodanese-like domain-containing protein [Candidatus Elarobacter sp.]